jgi:hypothetical protein
MRFPLFTAVLTLGLAGCGGGIPGLGGSAQTTAAPEQQSGAGSTLRNLALYGGPTVPVAQQPGFNSKQEEFGCPELGIIENAAGYRGSSSGAAPASGVAFQASIANVARECIFQGNQLKLRVGVEGRVLLGQSGRAGTFSVPIRVVVKRRTEVVAQRFTRLSVTVPGSDTQADFAYVEENLVVPITQNDPGDEYDVFVGLDPTGQQAQRQTRRR